MKTALKNQRLQAFKNQIFYSQAKIQAEKFSKNAQVGKLHQNCKSKNFISNYISKDFKVFSTLEVKGTNLLVSRTSSQPSNQSMHSRESIVRELHVRDYNVLYINTNQINLFQVSLQVIFWRTNILE